MAFFYSEFPKLIDDGHLYLSVPPLFKISKDGNNLFFVSIAIAICIAVGKTSFVD